MARRKPRKRAPRHRLPKGDKAFVHYAVLCAQEHFRVVRPA